MIVDSSALLAIIFNEAEEERFATAILLDRAPRMSIASYLEVALRLDGRFADGRDERLDIAVQRLGIELTAVSLEHGFEARRAIVRFGKGRNRADLNFGDCLTYGLARTSGEPLLFKGKDFIHTDLILAHAPDGAPNNG